MWFWPAQLSDQGAEPVPLLRSLANTARGYLKTCGS